MPHLYPCSGRYATNERPTRRDMLLKGAGGLGGLALAWMLGQRQASASTATPILRPQPALNLRPKQSHFAARAKSVIFLYMGGGPSQVDLFDPKPALAKYAGQKIPMSVTSRDLNNSSKVLPSPYTFKKHGQCGMDVSEMLPHLSEMVDDLALVRSGKTNRIDHGEALLMMHTGRPTSGFPTIGSWVSYGLGTENANLPAYIVMPDGPSERTRNAMSSGCLPALYQGAPLNADGGDPFFYLNPPHPQAAGAQRSYLDLTQSMNRRHQQGRVFKSELDARIQNYELAARMQVEAMQQVDVANEPAHIKQMYGLDSASTESFGRRCLIARRLVEAGVKFVHLMRSDWDHHGSISRAMPASARAIDQPVAALLRDLKQRGLLDSTLVLWTGEFGRLPVVEAGDGRDHNPFGFSFWMAGGGVKGGTIYGSTDEFGYAAQENPVTNADLHATLLHAIGLNADELTYEFEGRHETLIGVEKGKVIEALFA